ncbi:MAG: DUF4340 domain-containing protein, partial [Proteobacteria bacterium]|nr:DUF4340 domain-containing protein [Pseudomonadota bacterium]
LIVSEVSTQDVTKFTLSFPQGEKVVSGDSDVSQEQDDADAADLLTIEVSRLNPDNKESKDETDDSAWQIKAPIDFPGNSSQIRQILNAFLTYRYDEFFPVAEQKLAQFGIDDKTSVKLQLWTHSDQPKYQSFGYLLGREAPASSFKMYLSTTLHKGHVYFGPKSSVMSKEHSLNDFLDLSLPAVEFNPGDTMSLTLSDLGENGKKATVFQESFTKMVPALKESNEGEDEATISKQPSDTPIQLAFNPSKSDLVSKEALASLFNIVSGLKLDNLVDDDNLKAQIGETPKSLVVSFRGENKGDSKQSSEQVTLNIYEVAGQFYMDKMGQFFSLRKSDIASYFDIALEDFLVHPLPLALTDTAIKEIQITSHQHDSNDSGFQKRYSLSDGKWLATGTDDQAKATLSSDNIEIIELSKPVDLRDEITSFVSNLYSSHYHMESKDKPDSSDYELIYTVQLNSSSLSDSWDIYAHTHDSDKLWLHQSVKKPAEDQRYYFLKDQLLDDLQEPISSSLVSEEDEKADDNSVVSGQDKNNQEPSQSLFDQVEEKLTPISDPVSRMEKKQSTSDSEDNNQETSK